MRAAVIETPGTIEVRDVPDPTPGAGEVVVEVGACGVCGTDLHIAEGEFPPTPYPIVPGHEFAGTVVARGADVPDDVREGLRVAVDPSLFCGHCPACRAGRGNLCANWNATGDTVDGAFAQYVSVPAVNAYALPDEVDDRTGAMVEPLSCAVHSMKRLGPVLGEDVLVVGAGTMGLLLQQLLQDAGAAVTVVDRAEGRLTYAQQLGAVATATSVAELDGRLFAAAVDVTGAPPAIEDAFDAVQRGGRLMVFGVAPGDARVSLSPFRIYNDEITVVGSMAVLHSFGAALDLLARGRVDVSPLLTTTFGLDGFPDALQAVRDGEGVKVQVLPGEASTTA